MASNNKKTSAKQKPEKPTLSETGDGVSKTNNGKDKSEGKFYLRRIWQHIKSSANYVFSPFAHVDSVGFFTAVLAVVAYLQWLTFEKTDHTLKDTLFSNNVTNRAFVFAKRINITQENFYWNYDIIIENSGNTPTREMEYLAFGDLDTPTDPEDIFTRTPSEIYGVPTTYPQRRSGDLLGPKAEMRLMTGGGGLPASAVAKMAEERKNFYVRGVIHYRDAFKGTPEHVTKFCYALIPYKVGAETRVSYDRCLYWNCADEDCKADRSRFDRDIKAINSKPK